MRRLITTVFLAGAVGLLPAPAPADAQAKLVRCLREAIDSCGRDFEGGSPHMVAIRGYCYGIRGGICWALERF